MSSTLSGVYWKINYGEISEHAQFRLGKIESDTWEASFPISQLSDLADCIAGVEPLVVDVVYKGVDLQSRKVAAGLFTDIIIEPRLDTGTPAEILRFGDPERSDLQYVIALLAAELSNLFPADLDFSDVPAVMAFNKYGQVLNPIAQDYFEQAVDLRVGSLPQRVTDLEELTETGRLSEDSLFDAFGRRVSEIYIDDFQQGDGDSAAWQRAVNYAKANDVTAIWLPARTLELMTPVNVRGLKNVVHKGRGRGVSVIRAAVGAGQLNGPIICPAGSGGEAETDNLVFEDLTINGGLISVPDENAIARTTRVFGSDYIENGIMLSGDGVPSESMHNTRLDKITIRRVDFFGTRGLPFLIRGALNVTVDDVFTKRCLDGGWTHSSHVSFTNSTALFSGDNGFSMSRHCTNIVISNINVYGCWFWGLWLSGFGGEAGPENFAASNIVVDYAGYGGIALFDGPKNGTVSNVTVKNALRGGEGTGSYGLGVFIAGLNSSSWAENILVSDVTTVDCARGGILVRDYSKNILVDSTIHIRPGTEKDQTGAVIGSSDSYQNFGVSVVGEASEVDRFENITLSNNVGIDDRATKYMNFGVVINSNLFGKATSSHSKSVGARGSYKDYLPATDFAGITVGRNSETSLSPVYINGANGSTRVVMFQTTGANRFRVGTLGTAATFTIAGYSDGGSATTYLTIDRVAGTLKAGGPFIFPLYPTASLPSAVTATKGAVVMDTTRGKLVLSDGANWVNLDGTAL